MLKLRCVFCEVYLCSNSASSPTPLHTHTHTHTCFYTSAYICNRISRPWAIDKTSTGWSWRYRSEIVALYLNCSLYKQERKICCVLHFINISASKKWLLIEIQPVPGVRKAVCKRSTRNTMHGAHLFTKLHATFGYHSHCIFLRAVWMPSSWSVGDRSVKRHISKSLLFTWAMKKSKFLTAFMF